MRRAPLPTMLLFLPLVSLFAERMPASPGLPVVFGLDAGAAAWAASTRGPDTPRLSQLGYAGDFSAFIRVGPIVPIRFGLSKLRLLPSEISSDGQLYRGWDGTKLSLEAGYRFDFDRLDLALDLLAGASITAANYLGTPLVFAYPSILAEPRLDLRVWNGFSLWAGFPLELAIRGSVLTPSAGASLGLRFAWLAGSAR